MVIGIDGCKKGWVVVAIEGDEVSIQLIETLNVLECDPYNKATAMLIDIPTGFAVDQYRQCETEARQILGAKRSSVFLTPAKEAVMITRNLNYIDKDEMKKKYQSACDINRQLLGTAFSIQTFHIFPKIIEAYDFIHTLSTKRRKQIKESHPELCFMGFTGASCSFNKKTKEGELERLRIISSINRTVYKRILTTKIPAATDDIIDAAILALTACYFRELTILPADKKRQNLEGAIAFYRKP